MQILIATMVFEVKLYVAAIVRHHCFIYFVLKRVLLYKIPKTYKCNLKRSVTFYTYAFVTFL